ncbi:MAG TPA: hypothetical protein VFM88_09050 [Vicinamibacteria bacterium]|nr:hypothetical protein [Vicinamibacteria bacterium]
MPDEREADAERLRRIREGVRARALLDPLRLGDAKAPREPARLPPLESAVPADPPARPDAAEVNAGWDTARAQALGLLGRALRRAFAPFVDAQAAWNARQVQLDNRLLEYLEARFDFTHRHYDRVLGLHGKRLEEIDERHLILQEELVQHVHDLVRRIDLVLAEAEKGRHSLEFALRDVRNRLERLEEKLARG